MNFSLVFRVVGNLCFLLGLFLAGPLTLSMVEGEPTQTTLAFGLATFVAFATGMSCRIRKLENTKNLRAADAFACVSLGWIAIVLVGALPYLASGVLSNPADAWFESMSGFTTTGASVVEGHRLETLPDSILLWRSLTQWLGGMGIIVLFVALLPSIGAGGSFLVQVEAPGPGSKRLAPRIAASARILWKLYFALTAVLTALLLASGLSSLDAVCHAFSTVSTGGFSTSSSSVLAFSSLVQWEIAFFMLIGGMNFALLYLLIQRRTDEVRQDPELRVYLWITGLSIVAVATALLWQYELPGEDGLSTIAVVHDKVRYAAFTVISVITSTGFGADDFDRWPDFCRVLLVILMVSGACAGSTSGGLKLARMILLWKYVQRELVRVLHPNAVRYVKLQGRVVPDPIVAGVLGMFVLYAATWLLGVLCLEALGVASSTSVSASITCLSNIGPGLGGVGPTHDYHDLPVFARLFLPVLMLLGRLEFYAVLMLFMPEMWKRQRSVKKA